MTKNIQNVEEAKETIKTNNIVLFMKGTKDMPGCGFSANVVQILNNLNVKYIDIDILKDDNFKEDIKKSLYISDIFNIFDKVFSTFLFST